MRMRRVLAALTMMLLAGGGTIAGQVGVAHAAGPYTWNVDSSVSAPSGCDHTKTYKTIVAAALCAGTGDTISVVKTGSYTGGFTLNNVSLVNGTASPDDASQIIVSCAGGCNNNPVILAEGTLSITGVSVTGGNITKSSDPASGSVGGGGIEAYGGTVTLNYDDINANEAYAGGAGVAAYGSLISNDTTYEKNVATGPGAGGGAIYVSPDGSLALNGDYIANNTAPNGAGIFYAQPSATNTQPPASLKSVSVLTNTATGSGGGIYAGGTMSIAGATIDGNSAADGGGIWALPSGGSTANTVTIDGSSIDANVANTGSGGGILTGADLTLSNTSLWENHALTDGGGLTVRAGATLSNDTIADNTAQGNSSAAPPVPGVGGGINYAGTSISMINDTIADNQALTGGGGIDLAGQTTKTTLDTSVTPNKIVTTYVATADNTIMSGNSFANGSNAGDDCLGSLYTNVGHNLIDQMDGCDYNPTNGSGTLTTGNVLGASANLQSNVSSPFYMNPKPGSPAIAGGDAVTCEALAGPGTTGTDRDELGDARNSAIRGGCDMGAYDGGAGGQIALTVNGASLTEPGSFSGTVATFTDHEATPQDKSDYTATINWGDATAATSGVVGAPVNGVYSVTGSHTYADDMSGGYPVTVTLTDTDGVGTVATNSITVSDASLTSIGPVSKSFVEGTSKNVNLGSFRDPGSTDCTGGDYLATLYWDGNAKQEAGTASLTKTSSSTCTFSVSATGTFAEEGTVTPFLQVCESDNSSNCVTISDGTINGDVITVTDPALTEVAVGGTVASQEGSSATYTVGSFTDPVGSGDSCGSGYTATIHWNGNGIGDPAGAVSTPTGSGPCTYTVTGSYTYADEGTYAPSVTVCEADNNSNCLVDISGDAAHVTDAALSASGATAGCAIFAGCDVTVATFTDTNNSCNQEGETLATQYSATLTRADGTTGTGLITEDPAGSCDFTVTDSHVYTDKVGPHTVGVSIADDGGATAIVSATVNVGFPPTSTKNGNVLDNTSTTCVKGTTLRLVAHYVRAGYDSGSLTYRYGTTVISGLKVNSIVVTGTKPANNGNTAVIVGTALQNNRPVAIEIDVSDTSRGVCNYDKTEIKTSMGYDSGPFLSSASVYL